MRSATHRPAVWLLHAWTQTQTRSASRYVIRARASRLKTCRTSLNASFAVATRGLKATVASELGSDWRSPRSSWKPWVGPSPPRAHLVKAAASPCACHAPLSSWKQDKSARDPPEGSPHQPSNRRLNQFGDWSRSPRACADRLPNVTRKRGVSVLGHVLPPRVCFLW